MHKAMEGEASGRSTQRLLNAQKAFTGIEDPVTKKRLSVGEAVQKGLDAPGKCAPAPAGAAPDRGLIDLRGLAASRGAGCGSPA